MYTLCLRSVWFVLTLLYGISTIGGYFMLIPFLYIQTGPIQLNINTQLKCRNSPISNNSVQHKYTVLFYLSQRLDPIS